MKNLAELSFDPLACRGLFFQESRVGADSLDRITSYNVCYTKLLRCSFLDGAAGCTEHSGANDFIPLRNCWDEAMEADSS